MRIPIPSRPDPAHRGRPHFHDHRGHGGTNAAAAGEPYRDPSLPVATRVADLLGRMSLDEKLGQMTQAERASVTNAAGHPVPHRLDAVRRRLGARRRTTPTGWANMYDGFQNGALATPLADPDDLRRRRRARPQQRRRGDDLPAQHRPRRDPRPDAGAADRPGRRRGGRRHRRATGTSRPCLCVARNDRWGRTYESFGEKPEIASSMTTIVTGLQGSSAGRRRPRCWPPPSTTSATAARPTAPTRATPRSPRPSCARSTCRRSRPRSSAASARSWSRSAAGTAQKLHGHQYLHHHRAQGRAGLHRLRGLRLERHRPDRRRRPAVTPTEVAHGDQRRHRHGDGADRTGRASSACCAPRCRPAGCRWRASTTPTGAS